LPFPEPFAPHRLAWQATAKEQEAALVPTGPSLHGIEFRARVLDGEVRVIVVAIRTLWLDDEPVTRIEADLHAAQLPEYVSEIECDAPWRAEFSETLRLPAGLGATLDRPGFTEDPRSLFPAIEAFFGWVLDTRGERRVSAPYR
jgi:hypothetical protein